MGFPSPHTLISPSMSQSTASSSSSPLAQKCGYRQVLDRVFILCSGFLPAQCSYGSGDHEVPRMELSGSPHCPTLEAWPQGPGSMAPLAILLGCGMSVLPTCGLELHLSGSSTKWFCRVRIWPLSSATVSEHAVQPTLHVPPAHCPLSFLPFQRKPGRS